MFGKFSDSNIYINLGGVGGGGLWNNWGGVGQRGSAWVSVGQRGSAWVSVEHIYTDQP